jgi:hypothetical protein
MTPPGVTPGAVDMGRAGFSKGSPPMFVVRTRGTSALESLAWLGMTCVLIQLAARAAAVESPPVPAAFGPADLSSWADSIGHTIEVLTMAVGAVVVAWHRWRRPRGGGDGPAPETPEKPGP